MVEITNWASYNPRADRGGFAWFRMDNQFYLHMRQRKGASADATVLLAFLLAECSVANGKPFKFRPEYAAELLGRTEKRIREALEELESMGDCVLKPLEAATSLTDGRTDETDRTDETERDGRTHVVSSSDSGVLLEIWKEHRGGLPDVREFSDRRRTNAARRWKEKPDKDFWVSVVQRLAASPFCNGGGSTGWRADFDFLLQPETATKVLEGKYDERKPKRQPAGTFSRGDDLDSTVNGLLAVGAAK